MYKRQISASHNTYYDNGIKLLNSAGEKMDEEVIRQLESYLDADPMSIPYARRDRIGKTVDYYGGRNQYIGYLISLSRHSFQGYKVGLDCANGSTWMIAKAVFDALGAQTYVINNQPTGTNINLNSGSTHIEHLQQFVKNNRLDVGFAFDGDADRCLAVDATGAVVDGDHIMAILALDLKEQGKLHNNTLVATIMSNLGLTLACRKFGFKHHASKVGDRYVLESLKEKDWKLGGEQSGHIISTDYAPTGDGIAASLMVLRALAGRDLAGAKVMEKLPQTLVNVAVAEREAIAGAKTVWDAVDAANSELEGHGRVLVRASGTEPLVRVMVEVPTQEEAERICSDLVGLVEAELG